jgi:hypothetical protein
MYQLKHMDLMSNKKTKKKVNYKLFQIEQTTVGVSLATAVKYGFGVD